MGWSVWHPDWGMVEMKRYAWRGPRMVDPKHGQEIRGVVVEDINGKYHAGVRHGLMPGEGEIIFGFKPEWTGKTHFSGERYDDKSKAIEIAKRGTMEWYKPGLAQKLKSDWEKAQVRQERGRADRDHEH
jgi:hypothetical protein